MTAGWRLREGDPITPELTAMRLLGGGSAYEAYLAFDEITLAPVVVKIVRPDQVEDPSSLRGLDREVRALARVNHPVVVRGLRHQLDGDRPHVVLENIDGPRLSSLIRRTGRLSEQQYLPLAIDLASALHYFRHVDVCHLDIKPSNVIMGAPARLIDLSVARPGERAARLEVPIGTDFYMAPEQCLPGDGPGARGLPGHASDVWGLGATLFHAVAGYRPFDEGDPDAADTEARFPQLVDEPYTLPDGVPAAVADVLHATLRPDPADRPAPRDVADALEPVLAAQPAARLTFKVNGR
ncbi:serine/threonine-protein kinase [Nocardioides sp. 1609]|uniref:serine/threonine-protein kinase n=1 Tax=Nocardioides sp. 1609 TaxID=2508327 RepID=UPI001FD70CCB|nr:serine/threonine-protein kinase [Nocardioides sp. 1609]